MLRRSFVAAGLAATWLALLVAPAIAQDGAVIDPDSPPGKEYALPLDSARNQGAPGGSSLTPDGSPGQASRGAPSGPAPAFGVGVGDGKPDSGGSSSGSKGAASASPSGPKQAEAREAARVPATERVAGGSGGGVGSLLWSAAIAGLLVAAGVGAAAASRRARPGTR